MPRLEKIPVTTPEGTKFKERFTQDEQDRLIIRRGLDKERATAAEPLMHALARAGQITDADFPIVGYRHFDGTTDYGLDEDDAFMAGTRPLGLNDNTPLEEGMIDWMIRKATSFDIPERPYDLQDHEALKHYSAFRGKLGDWRGKLRDALHLAEAEGERSDLAVRALEELRVLFREY